MDDAIHGTPGNLEKFSGFSGGVFSTPKQGDEIYFLGPGKFGLFAAESALGLS
ncbi:hypothetical protein [Arthrobacter alpinus]|uniref:hypothetical protein n=1 Tax=Arthrobacter alpinus TaxID=656366 RepID=UPI000AE0D3CE